MKKYKELRYLSILLVLFLLILGGLIYSLVIHNTGKMIIALVALSFCIIMGLINFNIMIGDTYLVAYEYMILFMYPKMIDFKDIKEVKIKSKHIITIDVKKHQYKMYIFNAEKVYETITEHMNEYKESQLKD